MHSYIYIGNMATQRTRRKRKHSNNENECYELLNDLDALALVCNASRATNDRVRVFTVYSLRDSKRKASKQNRSFERLQSAARTNLLKWKESPGLMPFGVAEFIYTYCTDSDGDDIVMADGSRSSLEQRQNIVKTLGLENIVTSLLGFHNPNTCQKTCTSESPIHQEASYSAAPSSSVSSATTPAQQQHHQQIPTNTADDGADSTSAAADSNVDMVHATSSNSGNDDGQGVDFLLETSSPSASPPPSSFAPVSSTGKYIYFQNSEILSKIYTFKICTIMLFDIEVYGKQ